ncbi:MAG: hypothetical protein ACLQT5_16005 [Steroidobacteraceae bacterium]
MNPRGRSLLVGQIFKRFLRFAAYLGVVVVAASAPGGAERARARDLCPTGWWADLMLGSYHIHPSRSFDEFNPGAGVECSMTPQWAALAGYYRNSLDRPSFYAGGAYTPQFAHWGWFRLGVMGGVISGYNFGRFGIGGPNNHTGPVLAPTAIVQFGRFGMNFIVIPPIPDDNLPFTVGFQARYRFK